MKNRTVVESKVIDRSAQQLLLLGSEAETGDVGCQDRGREIAEEEWIRVEAKVPVEEPLNSCL